MNPRRLLPELRGADAIASLLLEKDYLALVRALEQAPDGAEPMARGILASRQGDTGRSIALLNGALREEAAPAPALLKLAHEALADAYVKEGAYATAGDVWRRLIERCGRELDPEDAEDAARSLDFLDLLRRAPKQSMAGGAGFAVPLGRNAIALPEVQVGCGALERNWIVDTGANFCLLTEPAARAAGIDAAPGEASLVRTGGVRVTVRVGLAPALSIGTAVLRNVVVMIAREEDFYIPQLSYQIEAVLGHPVLHALSRLTFEPERLVVGQALAQPAGRAPMWLEQLTPLVTLEALGTEGLYVLDLGARRTHFSAKFLAAHADVFTQAPQGEMVFAGAGEERRLPAHAADIVLRVGAASAPLKRAPIATQTSGATADLFFGLVGQDFLQSFAAFNVDFATMTFSVQGLRS
jgi:hypothetical protein